LNTKTDHLLLGLLSHEPMTGYDMKKRIDSPIGLFWQAGYGSIYPALARLEEQGYVTKKAIKDCGREKIEYTITDAGSTKLNEWIKEPATRDEMHSETMLKIFFGSEAGSQTAIEHIDDFEHRCRALLPKLENSVSLLKELDSEPAHKYYMLTAMFGAKVYKTYLEWCEEAKEILAKGRQ